MKVAYIQGRKYTVDEDKNGWWNLYSDSDFICKVVSFEEARRVIWMYWTNLGIDMEYITEEDFDDANI